MIYLLDSQKGKIFGFDENGNIPSFPLLLEFPFTNAITIEEDIDLDGDLEVLVGASTGLYAYDIKNENGISEWPLVYV